MSRPYGKRGSVRLPQLRKDAGGKPLCRWCDKPVPKGRRSWCSAQCVQEYRERADWNYIREQIIKRDKVCRVCGACRADRKRVWTAMPLLHRRGNEQVWGPHSEIRYAFEVDHILAVEDGGTDDPSNLRLLCVPCHKDRTRKQRRDKALERRGQLVFENT